MFLSIIFLVSPCSAGRDVSDYGSIQLNNESTQADLEHDGSESFSVHANGCFSRKSKSCHEFQSASASAQDMAGHESRSGDSYLSKKISGRASATTSGAMAGVLQVYEALGEDHGLSKRLVSNFSKAPKSVNGRPLSVNGFTSDNPCEQIIFARSEPCPDSCPFMAEMENNFCNFKCVQEQECGHGDTNKEATVADMKHHWCRRCSVVGCRRCATSTGGKHIEECQKCMPGYILTDEKGCEARFEVFFLIALILGGIALLVAVIWYFDLACRKVENESGLQEALKVRHRSKLRQPQDTAPGSRGIGPSLVYPLDTNLCSENVAGPGNILFFRFQLAGLIWAIVLLGAWLMLGLCVSTDILWLGSKDAHTPQLMCRAVHLGRKRQMELIWTKVYWLGFAYLFSFFGAIWMAFKSQRLMQDVDNNKDTMADYVAICRGLPIFKGDVDVENLVKESVEKTIGEKVVGVSVCWNYDHQAEKIVTALEEEVGSIEALRRRGDFRSRVVYGTVSLAMLAAAQAEPQENPGFFIRMKNKIVDVVKNQLGMWQTEEEAPFQSMAEMLCELSCSGCAFVVFETEDSHDRALEVSRGKPVPIEGGGFYLKQEIHEPESCCWGDFQITKAMISWRMFVGTIEVLIALVVWTALFYLPYARYMASFSYANGDEPGYFSELIFIFLIVASQMGLFTVAKGATDKSGLCYKLDKELVYILMYSAALTLNLLLDMSLTAMHSYRQMAESGVRFIDGRYLHDFSSLQELLEAYSMQKSLGHALFKYCWPATYFVPYAAEPILSNYLPYHIGRLFVLSNKKLVGLKAQKAMHLPEQTQGRYADLIFNMILFCSISFWAPGYILLTGGAMLLSHIYVYSYEHWKTLRGVKRFYFASDILYKLGQKLFSIPVAIFAAAFVFKVNRSSGDTHKLASGHYQGLRLWLAMLVAFCGHIILHCCILVYLVPWLCSVENKNTTATYAETAANTPCTWFSANPVHCLRSKHIKNDDPPQVFYVAGKEHLMKKNPNIGAYYEAGESEKEVALGEILGF